MGSCRALLQNMPAIQVQVTVVEKEWRFVLPAAQTPPKIHISPGLRLQASLGVLTFAIQADSPPPTAVPLNGNLATQITIA